MTQISPHSRLLCLILCSVFLANSVLANQPEVNFWKERKANQTLALANPINNNAWPKAESFSTPSHALPIEKHSAFGLTPHKTHPKLVSLLSSLPSNLGSIRKINSPKAGTNRIVFHIQDVHLNNEAQSHIGKTVEALLKTGQVDLVALEGAFSPIDLRPFHNFLDQDSVRAAADYLLKTNKISGPIRAVLTSGNVMARNDIPSIIGIDDREHYTANVNAYRASTKEEGLKKSWQAAQEAIKSEKKNVFNRALFVFDQKASAYEKGEISFGDYAQTLNNIYDAEFQIKKHKMPKDHVPQLKNFVEALNLEKSLDFPRVETERSHLIHDLVNKLSEGERNDLLQMSVAHQAGVLSQIDFYKFIKDLCQKKSVSLARFPHMDAYIRYVLLAQAIDGEELLKEVKSLEGQIYESLIQTELEKNQVEESRYSNLMGKLLNFSLTKEEWEESKKTAVIPAKAGIQSSNSSQRNVYGLDPRFRGDDDIKPFKSFYEKAELRDQAMAQNLMKAIEKQSAQVVILVTGGFHSNGIQSRLAEKGFTTVTFVPRLTKLDSKGENS